MDRARRAGWTVLIVVAMVVMLEGGGGGRAVAVVPAWPPSTLVVSEVQTGGASASDEFVELANQGAPPIDLAGARGRLCDLDRLDGDAQGDVDGAPTILDPGRRILIANAAGRLRARSPMPPTRVVSRRPAGRSRCASSAAPSIDAVGWGDATNAFVEGSAAAGAAGRIQPRASPGRIGREWHRFE